MEQIRTIFVLILLAYVSGYSTGYKILFIPNNIKSHFIYFGEVAKALADENTIHMLFPSNAKAPVVLHRNISNLVYDVPRMIPYVGSENHTAIILTSIALEDDIIAWTKFMWESDTVVKEELVKDCESLLENKPMIKKLQDENYDLIIFDIVDIHCMPAFIYKLGRPSALISLPGFPWIFRIPSFPTFVPNLMSELTDRMTFWERCKNTALDILFYFAVHVDAKYVEKYVPEKPVITPMEIVRNIKFWFYLHDSTLNYPIPLMPNTLSIGDIMVRKASSLNSEYEAIMNRTNNTVILLSLGSFFNLMPEHWENKFCEAFNLIDPSITIIWKTEKPVRCALPSNVILRKWVPQNDILAHPKLKLFITHAGWNSYMESIHHGKPMIAIPIAIDQPYNAAAIQAKGVGIKMQIAKFQPKDLSNNINRILNDPSFQERAIALSERIQHRPMLAKEKITFWVNHIIRFDDEHLRSGGMRLSMIEFLMLDIMFVTLLAVFVLVILDIVVLYCLFRLCCRFLCSNAKKTQKTD